jgi:nicotinate-nucleotide adenylyltransferase
MNVFAFGGSFDPPHRGHQQVIQEVLAKNLTDQVWVIPVGQHPFDKSLTPADERLKMVELMVAAMDDPRIRVETYEIDRRGKDYTINTLQALQDMHLDHRFSWVVGADLLDSLSQWYRIDELLAEFKMYAYPRVGVTVDPEKLPKNVIYLDELEPVAVSSTQVRAAAKQDAPIEHWVVPAVVEYIQLKHFYQS